MVAVDADNTKERIMSDLLRKNLPQVVGEDPAARELKILLLDTLAKKRANEVAAKAKRSPNADDYKRGLMFAVKKMKSGRGIFF